MTDFLDVSFREKPDHPKHDDFASDALALFGITHQETWLRTARTIDGDYVYGVSLKGRPLPVTRFRMFFCDCSVKQPPRHMPGVGSAVLLVSNDNECLYADTLADPLVPLSLADAIDALVDRRNAREVAA